MQGAHEQFLRSGVGHVEDTSGLGVVVAFPVVQDCTPSHRVYPQPVWQDKYDSGEFHARDAVDSGVADGRAVAEAGDAGPSGLRWCFEQLAQIVAAVWQSLGEADLRSGVVQSLQGPVRPGRLGKDQEAEHAHHVVDLAFRPSEPP